MRIETENLLLCQRPLFQTARLEKARAHLSDLFWPHDLQLAHRKRQVAFRHNGANLSSLSIHALQYGSEVNINALPSNDSYLIKFTLAGNAELLQSGNIMNTRAGMACVMSPTDPIKIRLSENHNQLTLRLSGVRLHNFLEQELGTTLQAPIEFLPFAKTLSSDEHSLGRLLIGLCHDLNEHPHWFDTERLNQHLEEILLSSILTEMPHTYSQIYQDYSEAGIPDKIVHVKDYISSNFHEPISLRDLAVIAQSSIRSLQMAFKKELGLTPSVYIRNMRLDHAYRLLSQTGENISVTDAAFASGFTHPGKFSQYYKFRFHQLPSDTYKNRKKTMPDNLRFGSYAEFQCPPGKNHADVIDDVMAIAADTDKKGFEVFATLEHPFYEQFAVNPNPLAVFTALAERTENLKFRALCHTLPLHNPMVLAGEIAMVDQLTKGRIECGVGRGHPWLCKPGNLEMEDSMGLFVESLEILQKAWIGERFSYFGEHYNVDDIAVVPKPFQDPHPKIYQVGTSAKWFTQAAQKEWGIVVGGPVPSGAFIEPVKIYRDACTEARTTPSVGYIKAIYLDEDEDKAHREAQASVEKFIKFNAQPNHDSFPKNDAERERMVNAGYAFYTMDFIHSIERMTYDELIKNDIVFVGTPDKVGQQLLGLYDEFQFDELIIISHFSDLSREQCLRTQQLFADHIMPALRSH
ncbi:MAG: LLM class flavin-dependent oxidoreductase [Gammaproteobacteria bacterium]|nr:LLM class flavin-dependent oxidoreductase [Gammaproteobacteria bacterium]